MSDSRIYPYTNRVYAVCAVVVILIDAILISGVFSVKLIEYHLSQFVFLLSFVLSCMLGLLMGRGFWRRIEINEDYIALIESPAILRGRKPTGLTIYWKNIRSVMIYCEQDSLRVKGIVVQGVGSVDSNDSWDVRSFGIRDDMPQIEQIAELISRSVPSEKITHIAPPF